MIDSIETAIVGRWVMIDGQIEGDIACKRIERLTEIYLEKLGTDRTGWETLFRDSADGRYWERTYSQSESHGGGPQALRVLSDAQARERYPQVFAETE